MFYSKQGCESGWIWPGSGFHPRKTTRINTLNSFPSTFNIINILILRLKKKLFWIWTFRPDPDSRSDLISGKGSRSIRPFSNDGYRLTDPDPAVPAALILKSFLIISVSLSSVELNRYGRNWCIGSGGLLYPKWIISIKIATLFLFFCLSEAGSRRTQAPDTTIIDCQMRNISILP